ncbi:hypothetical protein AU252_19685 [Pseudarthrobacter sulfonivorans]|uniref:Uncharacterized protein n=1 Tax=Pseudarthrobacter sulfonivorans TaxID=121292 RepID=A0A0U3P1P2_9MICC|nr:hypothetical protein AU252_19685 [Pseudarthrobacter sulfonivorans]
MGATKMRGNQMREVSMESLQAQIKVLEDRVKALEATCKTAVKPENLAATVARRQQSLAV